MPHRCIDTMDKSNLYCLILSGFAGTIVAGIVTASTKINSIV